MYMYIYVLTRIHVHIDEFCAWLRCTPILFQIFVSISITYTQR